LKPEARDYARPGEASEEEMAESDKDKSRSAALA
jgi:hypothetical protein